ncbi:MAG: hypothetical protein B6D41_17095 [Chloroflexi bacterium UTCFX4]|nr:MAG: hypothetical protein B6D41_17095 [Chloroflexi bacterium UTCFX4]
MTQKILSTRADSDAEQRGGANLYTLLTRRGFSAQKKSALRAYDARRAANILIYGLMVRTCRANFKFAVR